jgi:hypothetical protein
MAQTTSVFSLGPLAFAMTFVLSRLSFALTFALTLSFAGSFSALCEQQWAAAFVASSFAFWRVRLVALSLGRMRMSDVLLLAKRSHAVRERFALLKSQGIPIRFACCFGLLILLPVIFLLFIKIGLIPCLLFHVINWPRLAFSKMLGVAVYQLIRRPFLLRCWWLGQNERGK